MSPLDAQDPFSGVSSENGENCLTSPNDHTPTDRHELAVNERALQVVIVTDLGNRRLAVAVQSGDEAVRGLESRGDLRQCVRLASRRSDAGRREPVVRRKSL